MKNALLTAAVILAAAPLACALAGCDTKPLASGAIPADTITCTSCHGDPANGNAAPPPALEDMIGTASPGVGAHQTHVAGGPLKRPVACSECHPVPATIDAPGHADGAVQLTWGPLAKTDGASPSFDEATGTCASVYCHGATLPGGSNTKPQWTKVDGSQAKCGTCHGGPPPAPHPQNPTCTVCHPDPADGKHINGVVDKSFDTLTCVSCHGDAVAAIAAPPIGTKGETATTSPAVGAHRAHLGASNWHRPGECIDCHAVPNALDHADGTTDHTWGPLAKTNGMSPAYDAAKNTCATVYCHGATLPGGSNTTPKWTTVDGTQAKCGTCHGLPPDAPHPQSDTCEGCHGTVVNADRTFANPQLHINGTVEVRATTCNGCHGGAENAAPPVSTTGKTEPTDVSVGAHQKHVADTAIRKAIACDECHVFPQSVDAPGHMDGTVDIAFGTLAKTGPTTPSWDHGAATCATVYCHGATVGGGSHTTPKWTTVDGSQATCGSCHGLPPPAPHPGKATCRDCHPDTVLANGTIDVAGGKHVDGQVEVGALTCISCHGSALNAAPPAGTHGETLTTDHAVGAHQKHLATAAWHRDVQCTDCHAIPQANVHANGQTDFTWSAVATGKGANIRIPAYDKNAHTCASVNCHGPNKGGGGNNVPSWTTVDGTQAACGSCHGLPPPAPHPQNSSCGTCHASVLTTFTPGTPPTAVWNNRDLHINGQVDF